MFFLFHNSSKILSRAALLNSLRQDYKKEFILGLDINAMRGWLLGRIVVRVTFSTQSTLCTSYF